MRTWSNNAQNSPSNGWTSASSRGNLWPNARDSPQAAAAATSEAARHRSQHRGQARLSPHHALGKVDADEGPFTEDDSQRARWSAVVLNCGLDHHGGVGTKGKRHRIGFALCLLIPLSGTAGCVYEYPEPVHTPTTGPEPVHTPTADVAPVTGPPEPYADPQVLERTVKNYAELDRLLKAVPEPVLLSDVGPLDGPARGFGKTEKVPAAGQYTVTAACVGASGATVAVGQEHPGAPFRPMELALDCVGATSHVIALQQGYIFAHLLLPGPGDTPWTGAVGGVRVSGPVEAPHDCSASSSLSSLSSPAAMRSAVGSTASLGCENGRSDKAAIQEETSIITAHHFQYDQWSSLGHFGLLAESLPQPGA